jgi:steroid delta-isomerase
MMSEPHRSEHLRSLVEFFENINPQNVDEILTRYSANAYFKDPFNEVNQVQAIHSIFQHMFQQVEKPRFVVTSVIESGNEAFIAWDFLFEMSRFKKGQQQCCKGSSHLRFELSGQVIYHRDYWDTSEELYEKIPVLGSVMRWLKKQAG